MPEAQVSVGGVPDERLDLHATPVLDDAGARRDGRRPAHPAQDGRTDLGSRRRLLPRGQGQPAKPTAVVECPRLAVSRGQDADLTQPRALRDSRERSRPGTGGLDFLDVRGSARLVRFGEGKCGEKWQGPEESLEPLGTASYESCKYRFGADSRLAQPHQPA